MRALFLAVALLLTSAHTQPGLSQTPILGSREALDNVLRSAVEARIVPGVVAIVTGRDSVFYRAAFGVMDAAGEKPMRPDAIFQIASMTKPITSLGVLMLWDDGLLVDLDDPAARYLPELHGREVLASVNPSGVTRPATRPPTVRDLLRHTSGMVYTIGSQELTDYQESTGVPDRELPLLHDPGARWTYGPNTAFLGLMIERLTTQPLPEYFETRIFRPLGMHDTSFHLAPEDRDRLVAMYSRADGMLHGTPPPEVYQADVRGDAGLLSTADDYARFIQLILGRGERAGVRLLSREAVEEMVRNQLDGIVVEQQRPLIPSVGKPFPVGAGTDGFGLGFQASAARDVHRRAPGSLSWGGVFNTHFWIDPENDVGVVLLLQMLPFYDDAAIELLTKFERALYQQLDSSPSPSR